MVCSKTKFDIDIFDETIDKYSYRLPTSRWPIRLIIVFLVDGAALNANILFGQNLNSCDFIYELFGLEKINKLMILCIDLKKCLCKFLAYIRRNQYSLYFLILNLEKK